MPKSTKNKTKMDVNNNDRNESKDQKDIKPVKKEIANIKNNLIKKLEALNGDLSILKSTLISGFKIISFEFRIIIIGFQFDYEKPKNPVEKKL